MPVDANLPQAPTPAAGPLPLYRLLHAVLFNSINMWSDEHFNEPVVVSRTLLGARIVVNDPAAIKWILSDNAANYGRDSLQRRIVLRTTGRSLFSAEGADWRLQRKALAPFFAPKAIAAYLPAMQAAAQACVDKLGTKIGAEIDLPEAMAAATVDVLGRTLFPDCFHEAPDEIAKSVRDFVDVSGGVGVEDLLGLPVWAQAFRQLRRWRAARAVRLRARHVIAAAKRSVGAGGGSLIAALASARDPDNGQMLGARVVEDNVSMLIGAGSDTVAVALTWSIFLLTQAPHVRERVEQEADAILSEGPLDAAALDRLVLTRAVIEEAMRLYPPAPLIGRVALGPDTVAGARIEAGAVILIAPWVVHRHRRLWTDPEAFAPERFLPAQRECIDRHAYLPFGAGPRVCIGMSFAMQESVALLATLLRHLRFERADQRPIALRQCVTLQPKGGLRMRVTRRGPLPATSP